MTAKYIMPPLTPEQEDILSQATSQLEQEQLLTVWGIRGSFLREPNPGGSLAITERDEGHRHVITPTDR